MPDTRITRTSTGWTDKDTGDFYRNRREAREKRRARRLGQRGTTQTFQSTRASATPQIQPSVISLGQQQPSDRMIGQMTSLQRRAFHRLTRDFRIDTVAANIAVSAFGYNAAVSYGHLRQAGATHNEAMEVISKGDPKFSLRYGELRAAGEAHVNAKALASI